MLIALRIGCTLALVWAITLLFPASVSISGGWQGIVVVSLVLAILNTFVRPVLQLVALPLSLVSRIAAILLINVGLLLLCTRAFEQANVGIIMRLSDWPTTVGVALALGLLHWILKRS